MKENEIRIGIHIIDVFNPSNPTERQIDIDDLAMLGNYKNHPLPFKPITLTEEWLLMFGFEYETLFDTDGGEYYSYVKGQFMLYNSEYCDVFKCDLNENYDVDVTKVNQLQNLYFALTNEELTLKS